MSAPRLLNQVEFDVCVLYSTFHVTSLIGLGLGLIAEHFCFSHSCQYIVESLIDSFGS
jgi:hypothetical protein